MIECYRIFLRLPCLNVLIWQFPPGFRRQRSFVVVRLNLQFVLGRRFTFYVKWSLHLLAASRTYIGHSFLNDNKKRKGWTGIWTQDLLQFRCRPKARTANVRIMLVRIILALLLPLNYPAAYCRICLSEIIIHSNISYASTYSYQLRFLYIKISIQNVRLLYKQPTTLNLRRFEYGRFL